MFNILNISNLNRGGQIQPAVSQLIKGIACVIIVLHHYAQTTLTLTPEASNVFLKIFAKYGGYSAVAVFFFLSGYGLMESEMKRHLSAKEYLIKRYWRILKPVVIVNLVAIPVYYCLQIKEYDGILETIAYLFNIKLLDGVLWFVQDLCMLYAYFYLGTLFKRNSIKPIIVLACVLCHIIIAAKYFDKSYTLIALPIFPLGIAYSLYKEKIVDICRKWITPIVVVLLYGLVSYVLVKNDSSLLQHAWDNLILVAALVIILAHVKQNEFKYKSRLGAISYEVYLVHYKIIEIALVVSGIVPNLVLLLALTIAIAFLTNKVSRLIPV